MHMWSESVAAEIAEPECSILGIDAEPSLVIGH